MTPTYDCTDEENADSAISGDYMMLTRHVRAFGVGDNLQMTGTTRSSEGLDPRRKRLLFRCWHRGTREMDMILGGFADKHIADLTDVEMDDLEALMELPDPDLYAAISGGPPLAGDFETPIFLRIKQSSHGLRK